MADDENNQDEGVQEVVISDVWGLAKPQPVDNEDDDEETSNRKAKSIGPKLGKLIQFLNNIEEQEELETKVQELDPATRQSLLQWATLGQHFVLVEWLVKKCKRSAFAFTAGKELTIYEKWIEVRKEMEEKAAEAAAARAAEAAEAAANGGADAAADEDAEAEAGEGEAPAEQQVFEGVSDLHEELGPHGLGIVKSIGELGIYQGGRDAQRAKSGLGRTLFPNGDMFTGEYLLNRREGAGTYLWAEQGVVYCGTWRNNRRHGLGRIVYPDGGRYYGSWANDKKEGTGRYTYPDGSSYHGQWVQDTKQGEGTYHFTDGSAFIGWFEHGAFVSGEWRLVGGKSFFGRFKDDKPIGPGVFVLHAAVKGLGGGPTATSRIEGEYTAEGVWRPVRTVAGSEPASVSVIAQGKRVPLLLSQECGLVTTEELCLIANFGPLQQWLQALPTPSADSPQALDVVSVTLQSVELRQSRVHEVRIRPTLHRADGSKAASHVVVLQAPRVHLLTVLTSGERRLAIVEQTAHAATGGEALLVRLPEVDATSPTGSYANGAFAEALRRSTLRVAAPTQQNTLPLLTQVLSSPALAGPATASVRVLLQEVHPELLDSLAERAASSLKDGSIPSLRSYRVVRLEELATLSTDALTITAALELQRRLKAGALPKTTAEDLRPPTPRPPAAEPRPDLEELLVEQSRLDAAKGNAAEEE